MCVLPTKADGCEIQTLEELRWNHVMIKDKFAGIYYYSFLWKVVGQGRGSLGISDKLFHLGIRDYQYSV